MPDRHDPDQQLCVPRPVDPAGLLCCHIARAAAALAPRWPTLRPSADSLARSTPARGRVTALLQCTSARGTPNSATPTALAPPTHTTRKKEKQMTTTERSATSVCRTRPNCKKCADRGAAAVRCSQQHWGALNMSSRSAAQACVPGAHPAADRCATGLVPCLQLHQRIQPMHDRRLRLRRQPHKGQHDVPGCEYRGAEAVRPVRNPRQAPRRSQMPERFVVRWPGMQRRVLLQCRRAEPWVLRMRGGHSEHDRGRLHRMPAVTHPQQDGSFLRRKGRRRLDLLAQ